MAVAPLGWRILLAPHPHDIQATWEEMLREVMGDEHYDWLFHCHPRLHIAELKSHLLDLVEERHSDTIDPRYALWVHFHGVESYQRLGRGALSAFDYEVYRKAVRAALRSHAQELESE